MNIELSPGRATFVQRLYGEYRRLTPGADPRGFNGMRLAAAPHIRALAERANAIEPEDFRKESERLSREYPVFGFGGLNGQMFVNQLVYAARDAERSDDLAELLGKSLAMPPDIAAACDAIGHVVDFVEELKQQVTKYGALAIWRVPYMLSYFWEAGDLDRFPIAYPSTWTGFERLGFAYSGGWGTPPAAYELVCSLIDQVRQILGISTWEGEDFLIWLKEMPFVGIDPGDFNRLERNTELNQSYVPKVGYPNPEAAAEAKANIDAVLRHLKSLQSAIKPQVIKLFAGDVNATNMTAQKVWGDVPAYRKEAWIYFLSGNSGYSAPSLQVGITSGHFYWGFHFGMSTKNVNELWGRAAAAFTEAEAAGARKYKLIYAGELEQVPDLNRPYDPTDRGMMVGWVVPREDPVLQSPTLAERIVADLSHFREAVAALLEGTPALPVAQADGLPPLADLELIGAHRDAAAHFEAAAAAIAQNGKAATWWSFRIREEFRERLHGMSFYLNLYRQGQIVGRLRVIDWEMAVSGELACPWPEFDMDNTDGSTSRGPARYDQFRIWLLFDLAEPTDAPLGLDAFKLVPDGVSPVPQQMIASFAYVTRSDDDPWDRLSRLLYLEDAKFVLELQQLLIEKHQLIFFGPPGTGKTFVAQTFAQTFVSGHGDVDLVQFHPSYSYEDFVEGLRPRTDGGALSYEVRPGLLRSFAQKAIDDPDGRYVLIIDEINRANLSKVFGELLFLLEYRNSSVTLPYSGAAFTLPANLFIIGTMNTSDRSIALVDFALRRRFGFVPFYPEADFGQLRRYLAAQDKEEYAYVADMLAAVNREIADAHYHLGHSYFMPGDPEKLSQEWIERTWRYSILPYLQEYWYDAPRNWADYEFAALKQRLQGRLRPPASDLLAALPDEGDVPVPAEYRPG